MHKPSFAWIGLAGADAEDGPRAVAAQRRLHWVMVVVALLAIPSYLLDTAHYPRLAPLAGPIDAVIFVAFLGETAWMLHLSRRPLRYLVGNWINLLILAGSLASLMGTGTEWVALVRTLRVAVVGLVLARTAGRFGVLFTRRGAPLLVGVVVLVLLVAGAMFYWLEPTIHNYWDGLWLAFETGTTVGYGDVVPTTGASRMLAALTALLGVSLMSLYTANIVSLFVDTEDKALRRELQHDIHQLRAQIAQLLDQREIEMRTELVTQIGALKSQLGLALDEEHEASRRELAHDLRALRHEIAGLRGHAGGPVADTSASRHT
jgi:voltage-gated potassium channel